MTHQIVDYRCGNGIRKAPGLHGSDRSSNSSTDVGKSENFVLAARVLEASTTAGVLHREICIEL